VTHQEAVTEVLDRARVRHPHRAVQHAEGDLPAAVRHVQQQAAVAARGLDRPQQIESTGELHAPLGVARRAAEIADARVHGMAGIHGEPQRAGDLLVGAGGAEGPAVEHERTGVDVEHGHGHVGPPSAL
jgi:hypothetical protein